MFIEVDERALKHVLAVIEDSGFEVRRLSTVVQDCCMPEVSMTFTQKKAVENIDDDRLAEAIAKVVQPAAEQQQTQALFPAKRDPFKTLDES